MRSKHLRDLPNGDRGSRLVHQDEPRLRQPGARDGDRLALPAGHLAYEIAWPRLRLEFAEQFAGALGHGLMVEPAQRSEAALDFTPQEHIGGR